MFVCSSGVQVVARVLITPHWVHYIVSCLPHLAVHQLGGVTRQIRQRIKYVGALRVAKTQQCVPSGRGELHDTDIYDLPDNIKGTNTHFSTD